MEAARNLRFSPIERGDRGTSFSNIRIKLSDVFQQQQQQLGLPRTRRTSNELTVRDNVTTGNIQQPTAITKKHRRKSKDRHLEHL
ncbi:unnamed protein product [Rotaria sordida]|uniref:Uncharacterized protein n=1 Tax=Rotaria sordida TaxID=392033 RepID=A0A814XPE0_9BILA|nr:unnamed protein product [Rotaria sordida]